MKYSEEFIQLIDETENGEFIGFGNPNSKILFVGKECGLDLTNHVDKFVYEKSNKPNWEHWNQNIIDKHQRCIYFSRKYSCMEREQ